MKNSTLFSLVTLALLAIIAANCLFVVKEIDRAVLLTFGEVTNADIEPGLHWKIPGVHAVRIFDGRIQTLDAATQSYLTAEKEYLEVDSYAKWRIADVSTYYTATSGESNIANNLLSQRINTGLRNQFAERTVHEVVSGERDLLMTELTEGLNQIAQQELGVEVVDIRVKKIDLPPNVSDSVYQRMNTERYEEAQLSRSTGLEESEGIKSDADRQQIVIQAEAYRDAETIRGDGDAQAAAIYAAAYNKDPEFYSFTKSLNAYKEAFSNSSDLLLLSPDSDFFKYLNNSTTD
ncbi:protease modulator HflC [Gammaproteobacteria bacterium]|nr:protease modulator HflC [Gammaproteobacteria bacterium]